MCLSRTLSEDLMNFAAIFFVFGDSPKSFAHKVHKTLWVGLFAPRRLTAARPPRKKSFAAVDCYAGATIPNLISNQFYISNHIFSHNISVLLD